MEDPHLSVTEYAVIGLLADGPSHGFALSKRLSGDGGDLGRVFTVRRSLVYRALDRMVEIGYAEPVGTEQGGGPKRVIHRITKNGRKRLARWLHEPVAHVRDLRIEFLLKLALLERSGESPIELIQNQRAALEPTLTALDDPGEETTDHVELWRRHNAAAAASYLEALVSIYG
jgi:DNA-binding PadR family transcriptional regulator